jgi:hypothetical protein
MKNLLLYLICVVLLSCNGNRYNSDNEPIVVSKIDKRFNGINQHSIEDRYFGIGTPLSSEIIQMPEYQEKRKEIIAFCDLFISTIQSNNIEKVAQVIDFPIWVECYRNEKNNDFDWGDTITENNYFHYKKRIFDKRVFRDIMKFKALLMKNNVEVDEKEGFDIREDCFRIGVDYLDGKKVYIGGMSRIFRFERKDNTYKLVLVFCAG